MKRMRKENKPYLKAWIHEETKRIIALAYVYNNRQHWLDDQSMTIPLPTKPTDLRRRLYFRYPN